MGFRLEQFDLTLGDLEGPKTKVALFDVKFVVMTSGHIDSSSLDLLPKNLWPSCFHTI